MFIFEYEEFLQNDASKILEKSISQVKENGP